MKEERISGIPWTKETIQMKAMADLMDSGTPTEWRGWLETVFNGHVSSGAFTANDGNSRANQVYDYNKLIRFFDTLEKGELLVDKALEF